MIINHNMNAMNAHRQMGVAIGQQGKSIEKLSSGLRINRAGDDAAGLAISEKMRGQIRGLDQASRNAQDSISLIQTAEGALNETHSILQRMRELAVQSSNDTNNDSDRKAIQDEINQLADEIDRIGNTTEFNTKKLLNGDLKGVNAKKEGTIALNNNSSIKGMGLTTNAVSTAKSTSAFNGAINITMVNQSTSPDKAEFKLIGTDGKEMTAASGSITIAAGVSGAVVTLDGVKISLNGDFSQMKTGEGLTLVFNKAESATTDMKDSITAQIGANSGQTMQMGISDMRSEAIGIKNASGQAVKVDNKFAANTAISTINNALEKVSEQRSKLGAFQNRLEHTINNLGTSAENLQASESRVRDIDMAKEMMNQSKQNILQQASQAMLAQANQQPQGVLQLLR